MAASLQDVLPKRKLNELEDITNSNTFRNKRVKVNFKLLYDDDQLVPRLANMTPQQERLPLPSDMSSLPSKPRCKLVSFELLHNKHYEDLPLLTPKDDDDDDYPDTAKSLTNDLEETAEVSGPANLDTNPDYVALAASLRLLTANKDQIHADIASLSRLSRLDSAGRDEIVLFFVKLMNNELDLPKQRRTVAAPTIDWAQYHASLAPVSSACASSKKERPLFKALNVFHK